jgi:phage shock protein A
MSKRGIIGRVAQLARADLTAVIDSAENPRAALDLLVDEYSATIAEAGQAVAQLTDNKRIAQEDQRDDAEAAGLWGQAIEATSQTADELRAAGEAADADLFDNLARAAIARQLIAENDIVNLQHTIDAQAESVETLTSGLDKVRIKLAELAHQRNAMAAHYGGVHARPGRDSDAVETTGLLDPASEVARFEQLVRREEVRVRGSGRVPAPSAPAPSRPATSPAPLPADLTDMTDVAAVADQEMRADIDERLKAVKIARAMASALARAHEQEVHPLRPDQLFR